MWPSSHASPCDSRGGREATITKQVMRDSKISTKRVKNSTFKVLVGGQWDITLSQVLSTFIKEQKKSSSLINVKKKRERHVTNRVKKTSLELLTRCRNGTIRFPEMPTWLGAIVFGFNLYQREAAGYLSSLVMAFFFLLQTDLSTLTRSTP